jgi:VCBS repeat-containing protein
MKVNQGGTQTVLVGGAGSVLANDSDAENDTLSASVVTNPAHGTLTLNTDGTFLYTHDGSANNTDSFVYKACDPAPLCSADTTVTITVNLKPVAGCTVSPQMLKEGDVVSIALGGLFTDPESTTLSFSATGVPSGLTVNPGTGLLSGTVAAGAATGSPYTLAITATDAGGASFTRNLAVAVLSTTDALFRADFEDAANAASCH